MKTHPIRKLANKAFTLLELLVVITIISILAGLAIPTMAEMTAKGYMAKAGNNAKQIVTVLKSYAADHHGLYPDADRTARPETANDAFRVLFATGVVKDERIFSSPVSSYQPDEDYGSAPDFAQALEPGENHWCLTKGLSDSSDGNAPLVFENTAGTSWPPTWNCDLAGRPVDGRAWRNGRIIIARNDGSTSAEPLASISGDSVTLKPHRSGKDLFTQLGDQGSFLDIAR
jgi:prepilin-type N-terminal cleavage/methylation domain-containing protein